MAEEPRWNVRMAAQSGLYTLAKHGSYYWSEEAVTSLIEVASSTDSEKLASYIFDILIILSQSPAICQMHLQSSIHFIFTLRILSVLTPISTYLFF